MAAIDKKTYYDILAFLKSEYGSGEVIDYLNEIIFCIIEIRALNLRIIMPDKNHITAWLQLRESPSNNDNKYWECITRDAVGLLSAGVRLITKSLTSLENKTSKLIYILEKPKNTTLRSQPKEVRKHASQEAKKLLRCFYEVPDVKTLLDNRNDVEHNTDQQLKQIVSIMFNNTVYTHVKDIELEKYLQKNIIRVTNASDFVGNKYVQELYVYLALKKDGTPKS